MRCATTGAIAPVIMLVLHAQTVFAGGSARQAAALALESLRDSGVVLREARGAALVMWAPPGWLSVGHARDPARCIDIALVAENGLHLTLTARTRGAHEGAPPG